MTEKINKKTEIEIPENLENIVKEIEELKLKDLVKLIKILEEKFEISAQMPVMMPGIVPQGGLTTEKPEAEKTEFSVFLKNPGSSKIPVIKLVREITEKGLKESKDLVDNSEKEPQLLKEKVKKEEAEEIKKKFEGVGAVIEIK